MKMDTKISWLHSGSAILIIGITSACSPTIKVEAPDKPIEINMNVKIEHEVRVRVERDLENEFASNPELFGVNLNEGKKQ